MEPKDRTAEPKRPEIVEETDQQVRDEMQRRYDAPDEEWLTREEFRKIWDI